RVHHRPRPPAHASVVRLRHPPLRRHAARGTATAHRLAGNAQALRPHRGGGRAEAGLFLLRARHRAIAGPYSRIGQPCMTGRGRLDEIAGVMELPGFSKVSGMRLVSAETGKVTLALARRPELTQFLGHFHGGVITALADQAAGAAVTSTLPEGKIA